MEQLMKGGIGTQGRATRVEPLRSTFWINEIRITITSTSLLLAKTDENKQIVRHGNYNEPMD